HGGTGEERRALAAHRPAARARGTAHRPAIRPADRNARRAACVPAHRHAGAQPSRYGLRGAYAGRARRRRATRPARAAAVCSGAGLWRRSSGRDFDRDQSVGPSVAARRFSCGILAGRTLGRLRGAARRTRLMNSTLFHYASPQIFFPVAGKLIPWFSVLAGLLAIAGLYVAFFVAPTDATQGEAYRIIFIHVPAAWMSMFIYVVMAGWA